MTPRSTRIAVKKLLRILGVLAVTLFLLLVAIVGAFYHLIQGGEFRRVLLSELESRTQLKANVGSAEIRFGSVMGISLRQLVLLEPDSGRPVLTSERVLVRVALMPLLERRLDFYEIRFHQPTVQVALDEKGEVRLLHLLLPPVESQRQEGPFALDLRQIRIEKGEVVFSDQREGRPQTLVRFQEIDLILRRLRPKADSRAESQRPAEGARPRGVGPALEFSLKAAVEKDGRQARLSSYGRLFLPEAGLTFSGARLEAESQIEALPADLFWDFYGPMLGLQAVHGTIDSRLRWRGSLGRQISVKGRIEFRELQLQAPQIFASTVAPGDTQVELEVEWTPKEIRLPRLDWRSKEIGVTLRGTVSQLDEKDPLIELHLTTPFLPLVKARSFFPAPLLRSPTLGTLIMATNQGEVSLVRAGVAGHLSEIRGLSDPGLFWLEAELQELGGQLSGERQLPWRGWSGRIILEHGTLSYKGINGMFGSSRVTELNGVQQGLFTGGGVGEARVRGELDLKELREQLRPGLLPPQISKINAQLQDLGGRGKFEVFLRKAASSPYHVEGRLGLENAAVRVGDLLLNQISGGVTFSPKEIRLEKLSGLLAGSPLRASGSLSQYMTERSTFDFAFESPGIKAGVVSRLLLSSGSLDEPGTVRGSIRYQGSLQSAEDRRLSGTLELAGAQFPLLGQTARDLSGKVSFDKAGIDFAGLRGRLAGSVIEFRGQWRYGERPQLVFSLNSPEMDLVPLFSQIDNRSSDWYDRLQVKGRVSIKKGKYENFEFSDLQTDLALDKRTWRLSNFSARSSGGAVQGSGSFTDSPENLSFALESNVKSVPVKGLLSWFDMKTTEITGKVHLVGKLDSSGKTGAERKRNLNGAFRLELEDGVIRRLRVLVLILNLLDLSRWFTLEMPDLNQEGIRFRRISGDFKVSRGVYSTQNLLVDSDDLRLSGAGNVDGAEGDLDFVVAVRPFPRVTAVVSSIPLIGQGLAAIKNSFLVASFRVTGSLDNPIVIPAPLSTLSEFFFGALEIPKSLIGLSGDENK